MKMYQLVSSNDTPNGSSAFYWYSPDVELLKEAVYTKYPRLKIEWTLSNNEKYVWTGKYINPTTTYDKYTQFFIMPATKIFLFHKNDIDNES